jgi:hypothetical protein
MLFLRLEKYISELKLPCKEYEIKTETLLFSNVCFCIFFVYPSELHVGGTIFLKRFT